MSSCKHCGLKVLSYSFTHTSDGAILCNACSRYLFDLAKDVTLTYPEYDRLRDEDDYIQDTKIWYLNIILQNMYFHSGKEIIPDAMRIVLRNIAKIENDYCIKTFRKVRSTINKLEEYRMYVDLNPTEDKFRKDIRGKHHFDIEKEYNKITGKEEVKVWN